MESTRAGSSWDELAQWLPLVLIEADGKIDMDQLKSVIAAKPGPCEWEIRCSSESLSIHVTWSET